MEEQSLGESSRMTCVELQESLAEVEDGSRPEQRAHLQECPGCSALVRELDLIISAAGELQGADEPSPRVWNSIAIAFSKRSPKFILSIFRRTSKPSNTSSNFISVAAD